MMSPRVWEASGHLESFTDPLVECLNCHQRFRADHLPGFHAPQSGHEGGAEARTLDMAERPKCPNCGHDEFTDPRNFNLMFKTHMGPVVDEANAVYLRPETAQGMFVDFVTIQSVSRKKVPFGKILTTCVRRLISSLRRSSMLVLFRCLWCWRGRRKNTFPLNRCW